MHYRSGSGRLVGMRLFIAVSVVYAVFTEYQTLKL